MNSNINLKKRILLERDRQLYKARKKGHQLQQLFWECTLRCNLNCQHCGSDCKVSAVQEDMPLEHFLPVLDEIAANNNPSEVLVVTTGGEPLVRKDITECGRAITQRGFAWGMVSNGMMLDAKMLDKLIDAGLQTIAISLDGFEDEHNWMRGNRQSFARAVTAIKALADATADGRQITWDVITCVNKRNINQLPAFKDFLMGIGVRQWRIFTVFPAGRAKDNAYLMLSKEETRQVMDFITRTRAEGGIMLNYSCEGFLGPYEYDVRDHSYFCQAGINVASILCDGSISGCLSIRSNYHQGNIYKQSFWQTWLKGFDTYRNRQWMKTDKCADCDLWRYCEGNGMHLRDDDGKLILCNLEKI